MPTIAVHISVIGPPPLSSGSDGGSASPQCYAPNLPDAEQKMCVCEFLLIPKRNDDNDKIMITVFMMIEMAMGNQ